MNPTHRYYFQYEPIQKFQFPIHAIYAFTSCGDGIIFPFFPLNHALSFDILLRCPNNECSTHSLL